MIKIKKIIFALIFFSSLFIFKILPAQAIQETKTITFDWNLGNCEMLASPYVTNIIAGDSISLTFVNNSTYSLDVTYPGGNTTVNPNGSSVVTTSIINNWTTIDFTYNPSPACSGGYSSNGGVISPASGSITSCTYISGNNQWEVDLSFENGKQGEVSLFRGSTKVNTYSGFSYTGGDFINVTADNETIYLRNGTSSSTRLIHQITCQKPISTSPTNTNNTANNPTTTTSGNTSNNSNTSTPNKKDSSTTNEIQNTEETTNDAENNGTKQNNSEKTNTTDINTNKSKMFTPLIIFVSILSICGGLYFLTSRGILKVKILKSLFRK